MLVKELKKILENMDDDGVVEISLPIEGEHAWWDCKELEFILPDGSIERDRKLLLLKPTEVVMS